MKSNEKKTTNSAFRDSCVAGRRHFYQQVSVAETVAPWISIDDDDNSNTNKLTVASSTSASMDGTGSATGVSRKLSRWLQL
jgi:hypothetical protein